MNYAYEDMAQVVAARLNKTHDGGWSCIDASEAAAPVCQEQARVEALRMAIAALETVSGQREERDDEH